MTGCNGCAGGNGGWRCQRGDAIVDEAIVVAGQITGSFGQITGSFGRIFGGFEQS